MAPAWRQHDGVFFADSKDLSRLERATSIGMIPDQYALTELSSSIARFGRLVLILTTERYN
ncbi:MAG TPA: hypothetical protein VFH43_11645 [Candidatus Kapabacteria bacterium]|nr:hypothetical protein [Candidatus Kapabacteria bacterium]